MTRVNWTDDENATLREMWRDGRSGSQIAAVLGKSRCAVLGKVNRLELKARLLPPGQRRKPAHPLSPRFTPQPSQLATQSIMAVEPQPWLGKGLSILEVGHDRCRAVIDLSGDPKGLAVMCAAPTEENKPWCEGHKQLYCIPHRR